MTAVDEESPPPPPPAVEKKPWLADLPLILRLALRWAFIAAMTVLAFHESLLSVAETVSRGGLNSYLVVVPVLFLLAASGVALRDRTELPIHDRETDLIVGIMGLVLAALLQAVLLGRYAMYFHLLRLDLVALWLFVLSSSVVLFGLRPVYRFRWPWLLLLAVFPLPYHIAVILLGGTHGAAGLVTLMMAALATAISVGRTTRRGWIGAISALAVGLVILGALTLLAPYAPFIVFQAVPALTSSILVGCFLYFSLRRGSSKLPLAREVEPLAAHHVWSGFVLVAAVALALSFVSLPKSATPPASHLDHIEFGAPLIAPPGWHVTETHEYRWVQRLYGRGATLIRQKFVADVGNPAWDKFARPRAIVVDSVTTERPFAFQTYPAKVLYHIITTRQSAPRNVELAPGIDGVLVNVVDDDFLIAWNALDWTWGNDHEAQQVTVFAVDDHESTALFPQPTGALGPTLGTMFTVLLRGNAAVTDDDPAFKDANMLTEFGRGLVAAQLHQEQPA